ncbi:MAG TPA: hypothetical protein VMJ32_17000 [Pirellulales bacterium]|nr:hypothetical protein [Pirellulales bacterium]
MITTMAKKYKLLSEQLRDAILGAEVSRARIARDCGLTESLLSRFLHGRGGLGQESIDTIGKYLGLQMIAGKQDRKTSTKGR